MRIDSNIMTKTCSDVLDQKVVRLVARGDFRRAANKQIESVSTSPTQPNGQIWGFFRPFESFHHLDDVEGAVA
jgi:hypothetical protein